MKLTLGLTLAMALCATSATYPQWHEGGEPAEDTPSSRSIGDFAAMLTLSSKPNEFLEEWNRPASADFAPRMETADRVKRGDIIVAFVLFSGCSPSEDGLCDASVDFEVLRPDGAEYSTIADAELWRGKAPVPKPYLQLGTTYLGLVIEPQDPLGDYTVNAQVCDSVSDRCLDLTEQFEATHRLQEFELDEFMNGYYLDPRPDLVPRALRDLSDKGTLSDPNAKPPVLSFLAEVFSNNRERLEDWRGIIDEMEAGARGEILRAVSLSRDPKAIQTSEELSPSLNDMCWGGFFATGDTGYLQKVLDNAAQTNDREDLLRYLTGSSAMWSLSSNARAHLRVKQFLERTRSQADPTTQALIGQVLEKHPAQIQAEATAFVEKQHRNGVW